MNDRGVVDFLVNAHGLVNHGRLHSLTLNDRLNCNTRQNPTISIELDITHRSRGCGGARAGSRVDPSWLSSAQHHAGSACFGAWCAVREASAGVREASPPCARE